MCVQRLDDSEFCNSHYVSHFAAFFIVTGAKTSLAEGCFLLCILMSWRARGPCGQTTERQVPLFAWVQRAQSAEAEGVLGVRGSPGAGWACGQQDSPGVRAVGCVFFLPRKKKKGFLWDRLLESSHRVEEAHGGGETMRHSQAEARTGLALSSRTTLKKGSQPKLLCLRSQSGCLSRRAPVSGCAA